MRDLSTWAKGEMLNIAFRTGLPQPSDIPFLTFPPLLPHTIHLMPYYTLFTLRIFGAPDLRISLSPKEHP